MATLTLQAALQELNTRFDFYANPANRSALLNLVQQVNATNSSGSATVLYSGALNSGLTASDVINTLKNNNENLRLIDKTDAFTFLTSEDFREVVAKSYGLANGIALFQAPTTHPANQWLFHPSDGPWAKASAAFAASASGEVFTLTSGADSGRIFGVTELPTLINNEAVTHINGIARTDLKNFTLDQAFKAVAAQSEVRSGQLLYMADDAGRATKNSSGVLLGLDARKFFDGSAVELKNYSSDATLKAAVNFYTPEQIQQHAAGREVLKNIQKPYIDQANLVGEQHHATRYAALKALDKLGVAGDMLGLALVATQANAAYASGNKTLGDQLLSNWAAEFTGGLAGGIIASKMMSSGLLAAFGVGVAGTLMAQGLVLAAGLAGAVAGAHYLGEFAGDWAAQFKQEWLKLLDRVDAIYQQQGYRMSPLVLDLDGDGVETIGMNARSIYFDHNKDGFKERTGWVGAHDGLLVRDINNNGQIDNGGELFGNHTLANGQNAQNGFEALRTLDSNQDGLFSSADAAWTQLRVWKDANSNAKVDAGELLTLNQAKVSNINLNYWVVGGVDAQGNDHREQSVYTSTNGGNQSIHDVWFQTSRRDTEFANPVTITADVKALFNLQGSGQLADLHTAMMLDTTGSLKAWVTQMQTKITQGASIGTIFNDTHTLMLRWASADTLNPEHHHHFYDVREASVLEKLFNQSTAEIAAGMNRSGFQIMNASLHHAFKIAQGIATAEILKQTLFAPVFAAIKLEFKPTTGLWGFNATDASNLLSQMVINKPVVEQLALLSMFKMSLEMVGGQTQVALLNSFDVALQNNPTVYALWQQANYVDFRFGSTEDDHYGDEQLSDSAREPILLFGGDGHDHLKGVNGNDFLDGGNGDDMIFASYGHDTLAGRKGNDEIFAGYTGTNFDPNSGQHTILYSKGDGRDIVYVGNDAGIDPDTLKLLDIASTEVRLVRTENNDLRINFTFAENEFILIKNHFGYRFNQQNPALETIQFSDGVVWNKATINSRVLNATSGNDVLVGYETSNNLRAGNGSDKLYGGNSNDTLRGENGNDTVYGYGGNDTLYGGNGRDVLWGSAGNDTLYGDVGNDDLFGEDGDDQLHGGQGDDYISGGQGNDTIHYRKGDGRDVIVGVRDHNNTETLRFVDAASTEVKFFRDGSDLLMSINSHPNDLIRVTNHFNFHATGQHLLDRIQFSDNITWSASTFNARAVALNKTMNVISGTSSANTLVGTAGHDEIYAGGGNDTIEGGLGDDVLYGNAGNDTYVFRKGHGRDVIDAHEYVQANLSQTETLRLVDTASTDVTLTRTWNDDLIIRINSSPNDEIIVRRHFVAADQNQAAIDSIVFSDAVTWNAATIRSRTMLATVENDELFGFASNDTLRGGDGDDSLSGLAGNDMLYGDNGNDYIQGGLGDDQLFGGAGDDSIWGDDGNDRLKGDGGNDFIHGGVGDDTLEGNRGDDVLQGGAGNNTYVFAYGDGFDEIQTNAYYQVDTTAFINTIRLTNIAASDVVVSRQGEDLIIQFKSSAADQIRVKHHFAESMGTNLEIDQIVFSDNTSWNTATIASRVMQGTSSADTLYGNAQANTLRGGGSNDSIWGAAGDDALYGDAGNDDISGGLGNDRLFGGTGQDRLFGEDGNDTLMGDAGADELKGGNGNDTLQGGMGNDTLIGGEGNDTFVYTKSSGRDVIQKDYWSSSAATNGFETLRFPDLKASDLKFTQLGMDLYIQQISDSTQHVKVEGHFTGSNSLEAIDRIIFSDAVEWNYAMIQSKTTVAIQDPTVF